MADDAGPLHTSHVVGAREPALLTVPIGQALASAAALRGDAPALICPAQGVAWSWAELARRADEFAAALLALGLSPGERIGIWSLNNWEWILTQYAAARAGLILVTINPAYRAAEAEYALGKVSCAALVTATRFKSSDYAAMLRAMLPELADAPPGGLRAAKLPALRLVIRIDGEAAGGDFAGAEALPGALSLDAALAWADAPSRARVAALAATIAADAPTNIQFTSGTTGTPKGVTLSHANILNNARFVGDGLRLGPDDRVCIPVPLYHCFGMVMGSLACLVHGSAMVLPGEGFDPLRTLAAVAETRCTALYGVPTMFLAELDHPEFARFDLSSLRTGIMAGAPCPMEVMRRVTGEMHLRELTICYGMTETSPVSFQSAVNDPLELRCTTVGRVQPHTEARIVDTCGQDVPRGATGELWTRGYAVMQGYWGEPELTREVLDASRWMHTGDLASIDADGFCRIVGRLKDLVIRGGENLYPREIEEFLHTHPDVQDAQVFGVPDAYYGEELCAWVRLRPGRTVEPEALRAFCVGRIAHQKVPRHVRVVTEYPMTVTGKPQKFRMRETMAALLAEGG